MLALAGIPLGHEFVFFDDAADPCAAPLGTVESLSEPKRTAELDALTYEFENITQFTHLFSSGPALRPSLEALRVSSDRLLEKEFFGRLYIETAEYAPLANAGGLRYPAIAKTRRLGYDGKGQMRLNSADDLEAAGALGTEVIVESVVPFDRELSIIAARTGSGEAVFYPVVENHHREGILRLSIAPAPRFEEVQAQAEAYALRVLEELDYVGVAAIELFQVGAKLIANEMAPRVHNSGHWTIEGAETSQFENHIRAVTGMPLGCAAARQLSAMVNIIGGAFDPAAVLSVRGAHLHDYGKAPRAGRKIGHVTVTADSYPELHDKVAAVERALGYPPLRVEPAESR
jgi:5-(carboxyamino)imidazole ribonucleotide synthase